MKNNYDHSQHPGLGQIAGEFFGQPKKSRFINSHPISPVPDDVQLKEMHN